MAHGFVQCFHPVMRLRIDELAQRASVSSRNIRAYQQRGLLPRPELQGRTGYYGEDHLRRLELIGDLQKRGFSLESIRQILNAWSSGGDINDLLGFQRIIASPWDDEKLLELSTEDIHAMFPEADEQPELVDEAVHLGLLKPRPDGGYAAPEILIRAGVALLRMGLSVRDIFALVGRLRTDATALAHHLIDVVSQQFLEPVADGALTSAELHELTETVIELRGLAIEVIRPFLAQELDAATDEALATFSKRVESRADSDGA